MSKPNEHLIGMRYGGLLSQRARVVIAANETEVTVSNAEHPCNRYKKIYKLPVVVAQVIYDSQKDQKEKHEKRIKKRREHQRSDTPEPQPGIHQQPRPGG